MLTLDNLQADVSSSPIEFIWEGRDELCMITIKI
jgi:hypothetical protein